MAHSTRLQLQTKTRHHDQPRHQQMYFGIVLEPKQIDNTLSGKPKTAHYFTEINHPANITLKQPHSGVFKLPPVNAWLGTLNSTRAIRFWA